MCDRWLFDRLARGSASLRQLTVGATSVVLVGPSPLRWSLVAFTTQPGQLTVSPMQQAVAGAGVQVNNLLPASLMCFDKWGQLMWNAWSAISNNGDSLTVTIGEVMLGPGEANWSGAIDLTSGRPYEH